MEKFVLTGKHDDELYRISLPTAKHFKPVPAEDLNVRYIKSQNTSVEELKEISSKLKALATHPFSMSTANHLSSIDPEKFRLKSFVPCSPRSSNSTSRGFGRKI